MTGQIHTESLYLVHESGTKFYETVIFHNADAKRFALVKRWGKVLSGDGGNGEILTESFTTARQAQAAAEKIIASKRKRGYKPAASTHGFHNASGPFTTPEAVVASVGKHYSSPGSRSAVLATMLLEGEDIPVMEENEVISEEPTPEPERDADFGSW